MLDDTLVIWGGEFGRTIYCQGKLTQTDYGRDHHPRCFSLWMAGGGIKGGIVHGETDDFSYNITSDPVHVRDFQATILRLFGIDHERFTLVPGPRRAADRRGESRGGKSDPGQDWILIFRSPILLSPGLFLPGDTRARWFRVNRWAPAAFVLSLPVLFHCIFGLGVLGVPIRLWICGPLPDPGDRSGPVGRSFGFRRLRIRSGQNDAMDSGVERILLAACGVIPPLLGAHVPVQLRSSARIRCSVGFSPEINPSVRWTFQLYPSAASGRISANTFS